VVFDPAAQGADQNLKSRTAVNLTSIGSGGSHSLTRDASAAVTGLDATRNRFTADDGGVPFKNGEAVVYSASGTAIGGLRSGQTYYVVGGGGFGFVQLAASAEDAEKGIVIDLTGALPTGTHTLSRSEVIPVVLNPSAARNAESSVATVLSIGNHKLSVLADRPMKRKPTA